MKKDILVGLSLVFVFILIVFVTGETRLTIPVVLLMYFIVGLKSQKPIQVFYIILPIIIVWISHFFSKDSLLSVAIFYLVFIPSVAFLGYLLKNKTQWFWLLSILNFILIGWYVFPNWFECYHNYGARVDKKSPIIELKADTGISIRLDTIKNKVIVLDFWSTSCGYCFRVFPKVDSIASEFKNNKNVIFYTVNIPISRDTVGKARYLYDRKNLQMKSLYADDRKVSDSLGFDRFPHLIILKNGRIRYNGRLVLEKDIVFYQLKDEVNKVLRE